MKKLKKSIKKKNDKWYKKVYDAIIDRARLRGLDKTKLEGYYEKHHIVPKCLGGSNKKDNLVLLTPKEHFVAHRILYRLNPNNKLLLSVIAMLSPGNKNNHRGVINANTVAFYRKLHSDSLKGKKLSEETKRKISEGNKGKVISQEHIDLLKKINTGRKASEETRRKMSIAHSRENLSEEIIEKLRKTSTGRKHSEESKKKISEANKRIIRSRQWCENISLAKKGKPGHIPTEATKLKMSISSNRAKKVIGPDNVVYRSIRSCAAAFNVCSDTIKHWLMNKPEKGFRYF